MRGLFAIGNGCKKLRNLILRHKGLEAIATGCKELTHLEVNGRHNIRALGLESIGRYCQYDGEGCKFLQTLQQVDYSNLGDDAICGIPIGCRNLKKLHIHCCYEVQMILPQVELITA
ncbi:F-box/LRR-repeat protein 4-like [Arachis stenosperma]|uniref:F-box/LRR-repeat protein 4-like n=1 Tax=Arachis stenosperma TaxID=217475 RepID=UPI0025AC338C|nr:F-box/LRR-repeat protein 4-like [Arachis stenosperma]